MQELTLQEDDRSRSRRPDWRLLDDKGKKKLELLPNEQKVKLGATGNAEAANEV